MAAVQVAKTGGTAEEWDVYVDKENICPKNGLPLARGPRADRPVLSKGKSEGSEAEVDEVADYRVPLGTLYSTQKTTTAERVPAPVADEGFRRHRSGGGAGAGKTDDSGLGSSQQAPFEVAGERIQGRKKVPLATTSGGVRKSSSRSTASASRAQRQQRLGAGRRAFASTNYIR